MMKSVQRAAITGLGYGIPADIRKNDAPIFKWLHNHPVPGHDLFQGYKERRVLAPGENVIDIMVPAAQQALDNAGLNATDIDVVIGYATVSQYIDPNDLVLVHKVLQMRPDAWVIPLDNQFTSYIMGLLLGQSMLEAGHAKNILLVFGGNWTRYVDYHTPPSISASDGAAAAVLSLTDDESRFTVVDSINNEASSDFGAMMMMPDDTQYDAPHGDPIHVFNSPTFHLTPEGQQVFVEYGEFTPPKIVLELLERNNLNPDEITLISHQASSVLMDMWKDAIKPGQYINTITTFANMTVATLGVNFAYCYDDIKFDNVVLLGMSMDIATSAILLQRNQGKKK